MPGKVHHPLFARVYARMADMFEAKGVAEHRDEMLAGATGRAIEVGAGTGLNFRHYPSTVTEVLAVEPEAYLRAKAEGAAQESSIPVRVVEGTADALPTGDETFDVAVASLVLCSVPDQMTALAEIRRVLRPGGELRFYEHIRSNKPRFARMQRRADVIWPLTGGGCHTSRATDTVIERAGFEIDTKRYFIYRPSVFALPAAPHVIGVARRP